MYARGGEYLEGSEAGAFDLQKKYLELVLGFMGLTDIQGVVVEPTLMGGPEVSEQKRSEAIRQARDIARTF